MLLVGNVQSPTPEDTGFYSPEFQTQRSKDFHQQT